MLERLTIAYNEVSYARLAFIAAMVELYAKPSKKYTDRNYLGITSALRNSYSQEFQGANLGRDVMFFASLGELLITTNYGLCVSLALSDEVGKVVGFPDEVQRYKKVLSTDTSRVQKAIKHLAGLTPDEVKAALEALKGSAS